ITIERIGSKWGSIAFVLLSLYFLLIKMIGLVHVAELRVFNALIMFVVIYKAIKEAKMKLPEFNYLKGIGAGVLTAFVGSLIFSVFGFFYLTVLEPDFINDIQANEFFGLYMNKYGASFQIFIEGSASGCLMSYTVMQYLKNPRFSERHA
ncbi:MAG: DUF4199 domain-containing protein, partial [Bacteroidota bacterium]